MKLFIQEETLNEIGNAIREKTETGDLIAPGDMPGMIRGIESGGADPVIQELEISSNGVYNTYDGVDGFAPIRVNVPQDGAPTAEELVVSGDCSHRFANGGWDWFLKKYGNQITTRDITNMSEMFAHSKCDEIPFEINCAGTSGGNATGMFKFTGMGLRTIPRINNNKAAYITDFVSYSYVNEVPDDYFDNWDWSYLAGLTSGYSGYMGSPAQNTYALRSFPWHIFAHDNKLVTSSNYCYLSGFRYMYALDEAVNLPIPYTQNWTSNIFSSNGIQNCYRLKNFTFALDENGQPLVKNWKSQNLTLHKNFGWGAYDYLYNDTLSEDKKVFDDESYHALKDDPCWYTADVAYSRYNHDSAVRTIQSLPDTSAYLASAGGTNTITFKGEAGSKTDGGAINTLTEEEIAIAAAKGWTVSFN